MVRITTIATSLILILMFTIIKTVEGFELTSSGLYANVKCRYYDNWAILENKYIQVDCSDDNIPEW